MNHVELNIDVQVGKVHERLFFHMSSVIYCYDTFFITYYSQSPAMCFDIDSPTFWKYEYYIFPLAVLAIAITL